MGGLERIWTDPASVNHETDWGPWNWLGAVGLSIIATLLLAIACVSLVWVVRLALKADAFVQMLGLALVALTALVGGLGLLGGTVHGMARHTASMWWVLVMIVSVYGLSYVALRAVGKWCLTVALGGPLDYEDEGDWWRRIARLAGNVYLVAAVYNFLLEGLNKASGGSGLAISFIVVVSVGLAAAMVLRVASVAR